MLERTPQEFIGGCIRQSNTSFGDPYCSAYSSFKGQSAFELLTSSRLAAKNPNQKQNRTKCPANIVQNLEQGGCEPRGDDN